MADTSQNDFDRWRKALARYTKWSKSELSLIINRSLLQVLTTALRKSPIVSAEQIRRELNVVMRTTSKSGKQLIRHRFASSSRAEAIIQGRLRNQGKANVTRAEARTAARKLVAKRLRSRGIVKSGFVKPIKILSQATRNWTKTSGLPSPKGKGRATPARPGITPSATAIYELGIDMRGTRMIHPKVVDAVNAGMRDEAREKGREIARRMAKQFNRQT